MRQAIEQLIKPWTDAGHTVETIVWDGEKSITADTISDLVARLSVKLSQQVGTHVGPIEDAARRRSSLARSHNSLLARSEAPQSPDALQIASDIAFFDINYLPKIQRRKHYSL